MLPVRLPRFATRLLQSLRSRKPAGGRHWARCPLRLELFEDRLVPATHTWTGMINNVWSVASNWRGGSPLGDALAALVFPANAQNFENTNDLANLTIRSIRFTGDKAYTIGGNPLTLNSAGISLASSVTTITDTLNLNIMLGANQTWRVTAPGATLDVEGVISGKHRLTKSDAGTLVLGAANLHNGTRLNAGTLIVTTGQSLGIGTLTLHGGKIQSAMPVTLSNAFTVSANSAVGGSNDITFTGTGTLSAGVTLTVADTGITTFSGKLDGAGTLTEAAATGTLILQGANTYTGRTTLSSGMLIVGDNSALGSGTLDLDGGTIQSSMDLTLPNPFMVTNPSILTGNNNLTFTSPGILNAGTVLSVGNPAGTVVLAGDISGAGGLAMVGSGVLVLTGNNTFTGATTAAAGTMLVEGTQVSSDVSVANGATVGGAGTLGSINAAGSVSPGGPGPGLLQSGNAVFNAGSSFAIKLNGANPGTDYDQLAVNGSVDLSGGPALTATVGFASSSGDSFAIIVSTGALTGTFDGLPDGATFTADGITLQINYLADSVILTTVSAPIPPPLRAPADDWKLEPVPMGQLLQQASVTSPPGAERTSAIIPIQSDLGQTCPLTATQNSSNVHPKTAAANADSDHRSELDREGAVATAVAG